MLSALGSVFAALIGGAAESQASATNWAINLYNARQRNKERQESIAYADKLRDEEHLGGTNAAGVRSYWDPVKGWVTELPPVLKQLRDYYYNTEVPMMQAQLARDYQQRREDANQADTELRNYRDIRRPDTRALEAELYNASTRGLSEATSETMNAAMRNALRMGSSDAGRIAARILEEDARQRKIASDDAHLKSYGLADEMYNNARSQQAQLYNMFASRAGQGLRGTMTSGDFEGGGNALQQLFAQLGQAGKSAGLNAVMKQGGTIDYIDPNFGLANAIGGASAALGGLENRMSARSERNDMKDLLMQYLGSNGNFNMNNGGLFGLFSDRIRAGVGAF